MPRPVLPTNIVPGGRSRQLHCDDHNELHDFHNDHDTDPAAHSEKFGDLNGTYASLAGPNTFTDTALATQSIIDLEHYGDGTQGDGQTYGLEIHNFPGANTAFVIHQYSHQGNPAVWIDNTDTGPALRIHNTANGTINPGRDGTGDYIQLQDHGTTISHLDKDLVWRNDGGSKVWTYLSTVGKALSVQQAVANTTTLEVIKASTGAGNAVDIANGGTGIGLHVSQTGAGKGLQVDANAAANAGLYGALIQGYDYAAALSTDVNSGTTLTVTKNGTGAGTAVQVINKGTGDSLQLRDASANKFVVDHNGFVSVLQGATVNILAGSADPEGAVTAPIGSIYLRTGGGVGTALYFKEQGAGNTGWSRPGNYAALGSRLRATGVLAETYPRNTNLSNQGVLNTGKESLFGIFLEAGQSITNIAFCSATTALSGGNNQWFSLRNSARQLLAITADDTSTAWAANTVKSLAITGGPYVVPTTGFYYLGCMVNAATPPTLAGTAGIAGITNKSPSLCGFDNTNTGLTTPATAPATSAGLANLAASIYGYVT